MLFSVLHVWQCNVVQEQKMLVQREVTFVLPQRLFQGTVCLLSA
jgi:hypothetical protein